MGQFHRGGGDVQHIELLRERLHHDSHVIEFPFEQALPQRRPCELEALGAEIGNRRQWTDLDLLLREILDGAKQPMLARLHQRDGHPFPAGPAGPADSMHVGLRRRRHIVVEDVRELPDVEAARRHVGGDQQVRRRIPESFHHRIALPLLHTAVQRFRAVPVRIEALDEGVHFEPGATDTSADVGFSLSSTRCRAIGFCARLTT